MAGGRLYAIATYSIRLDGRVHTTVPGRLASSGSGDRRVKRLGRRRLCRFASQKDSPVNGTSSTVFRPMSDS